MEIEEIKNLLKDKEDALKAFENVLNDKEHLETKTKAYETAQENFKIKKEKLEKEISDNKNILSELGFESDVDISEHAKKIKEYMELNKNTETEQNNTSDNGDVENDPTNTPAFKQLQQRFEELNEKYSNTEKKLTDKEKAIERAENRELLQTLFKNEKGEFTHVGVEFIIDRLENQITTDAQGNKAFINKADPDLPISFSKYKEALLETPEIKQMKKNMSIAGSGSMPSGGFDENLTTEQRRERVRKQFF